MAAPEAVATFLEKIFQTLSQARGRPVLQEIAGGEGRSVTGAELLQWVGTARAVLGRRGLHRGDRCALLAGNSIRWVAMDLALMAEGVIAVPLYSRQAPAELVAMMQDCSPSLICCGDEKLRDGIRQIWPQAPPCVLFDEIFAQTSAPAGPLARLSPGDPVTIIYTSGTSGEAKGVVLGVSNLDHMLSCTSERLDQLMAAPPQNDRVFHYLPCCFAGSWILLLTCLLRGSLLTLATDLGKLAGDMRAAAPHYFLNVPVLLERMRSAVDEQLQQAGGLAHTLYRHAKAAWLRRQEGQGRLLDSFWLTLGRWLVFPTIRKKMIGANLRALICGSAPLAKETQLLFMMLGIPVLQVYGLTETTAICTMDDARHLEPGRVGPAIRGVEMKLGEQDEVLVRGPNIFQGYWNKPGQTAEAMRDGWFHTGDQGEVNEAGNWKISGRLKNLIILSSGHNVAPEPIEDELLRQLPGAQQVVLVGQGRSFLSAIIAGEVRRELVDATLELLNPHLPHYKRIRAFYVHGEPFTVENGMLTANGKLKRDVIAARLQPQIQELYRGQDP